MGPETEGRNVEPETFGPFLTKMRKQLALTQEQLAQQLHVSTAAVSKWERAKCLPDIAKIESIADALQLTVLEVMQCQVRQEPLPEQELSQVYEETLQEARRQYSRRTAKRIVLLLLCAAALALLVHFFPLHHVAHAWSQHYFDTGEISRLIPIGTWENRKTAQAVLDQAEAAFSDLSLTRAEASATYGLLGRYTIDAAADGIAAERHSLQLWSAHFEDATGNGYMWVCYSQEGKDAHGNIKTGSWDIPSLWRLRKTSDGTWMVSGIKERP